MVSPHSYSKHVHISKRFGTRAWSGRALKRVPFLWERDLSDRGRLCILGLRSGACVQNAFGCKQQKIQLGRCFLPATGLPGEAPQADGLAVEMACDSPWKLLVQAPASPVSTNILGLGAASAHPALPGLVTGGGVCAHPAPSPGFHSGAGTRQPSAGPAVGLFRRKGPAEG